MPEKSATRKLMKSIEEMLIDGEDEDFIISALALEPEEFAKARTDLIEHRAGEVRSKSNDVVYIEYCMEQDKTIRAADKLIKGLNSKKQYNAVVGALRLRADLVDKKLKVGQDLGQIDKMADKHEHVIGGVSVSDMDNTQLRRHIVTLMKNTAKDMRRLGERSIMDLPSKPLHYGPTLETSGTEVDAEEPEPKSAPVRKKTAKKKRRSRK